MNLVTISGLLHIVQVKDIYSQGEEEDTLSYYVVTCPPTSISLFILFRWQLTVTANINDTNVVIATLTTFGPEADFL